MARATNAETITCANPTCGCPPSAAHDPHCSAYCANVDFHDSSEEVHEGESACACEHAACAASQEVDPSGAEARTSVGRP